MLIVHLTESYKLDRTGTALRDFVAHEFKRGEGEENSYKKDASFFNFGLTHFQQNSGNAMNLTPASLKTPRGKDLKTTKKSIRLSSPFAP